MGWLAGLGVVALLLSAATPTETRAFAVDQLEQAGQVVNNTASSPPCHTTNFGIQYYQFYTDSEYRVGRALHVFLFLGVGEGQPADYAVEADLDTQWRGIGTAPRVCQPCISCLGHAPEREFLVLTQVTTQPASFTFSPLAYGDYAARVRSLGGTPRADTWVAYGSVTIDLGAAGGSSHVEDVLVHVQNADAYTFVSRYESLKSARNVRVVAMPVEQCGDGVDNNGNGLIDEVCRGCSENAANTGSTTELASGNLTQSLPLLAFDRRPLSLALTVAYNSQDPEVGPLGRGWTHPYARRIRHDNGATLALVDAQGGYTFYRKDAAGAYSPLVRGGTQDRIVKAADGTYERLLPDGSRWRFDAAGNLVEMRDRRGNAVTLAYTGGRLAQAQDSVGRSITFTYDASGRIVQAGDSAGRTVSFVYDAGGAGLLVTVVDAVGGAWEFTYDAAGRMATKRDPRGSTTSYTYDVQGRLTQVTDPRGVVKQLAYDLVQRTTRLTDAGGATRVQSWDSRLDVPLSVTDPTGRAVSYAYDAAGNRVTLTDPAGGVSRYAYDAENRLVTSTNPLGQTTSLTYDPAINQVASRTGPDGLTTRHTYDVAGNLFTTTDPTGGVTSYAYDARGNVTQLTNPLNQATTFAYDPLDQLVATTDPSGVTTRFAYDAAGFLRTVTNAAAAATTSVYDALGRLTSITSPLGHTTSYTYDGLGNRLSQTDPLGRVMRFSYDARSAPTLATAADGSQTTYAYHDRGWLSSLTDALGRVTTYAYDAAGRLLSQTGPLGDTTSATYDPRGQLQVRTDPKGQRIEYRYDAAGRLVQKLFPDATSEQQTYDTSGRLASAASPAISYTFGYDAAGRLTSVTDSRGYTVRYGYDLAGRRTSLTYPGGQVLTYGYDAAGRLATLADSSARMTAFTYDTVGRRARVEFPNGTRALYGYDAAGRLTGVTHQTSAGATLEQFRYTYNAAGERTAVTTLAQTVSYGYDLVGRLTGVTATPTGPQPSEAFTYEAVGNRLTGPTAAQSYSYNAGHQLLTGPTAQYAHDLNGSRTQKVNPLGTTTYTWDAQDRLRQAVVSTVIGTATVTMAYDHRGRRAQKTVTGSSGGRSATATIDYVYDEDDIILIVATLQVGGGLPQTTMTRVVHGPDVDEPLWLEQGGRLAVLHADGLGSIVLATDATQAVVERTTYTAFGVPARKGSAGVQPFAFTGREWDVELRLYYYRARYYDPEVGRFLSRDPLGLAAGPNPYTYVENSPTNDLDPSGQIVSTVMCPNKRPWDDFCFLRHYYYGLGRPVDMVEAGLLSALRAAKGTKLALQATQARIQAEAVRQASTLCEDCDKGTRSFTFGTDRERVKRNFTDEPGLFVYGKGPLFTSSTCSGIANCATRTCSFDCAINFDVPDEFSDPFSFRERYGTPVEVGIPYALKARWVEQWAGAVGF